MHPAADTAHLVYRARLLWGSSSCSLAVWLLKIVFLYTRYGIDVATPFYSLVFQLCVKEREKKWPRILPELQHDFIWKRARKKWFSKTLNTGSSMQFQEPLEANHCCMSMASIDCWHEWRAIAVRLPDRVFWDRGGAYSKTDITWGSMTFGEYRSV